MGSRYSIDAVFRAIDKFTDPLKKMTKSTKTFSKSLKTDFAKAQRSVRNFTKNFKKNLGRNILIGVGAATAAITKLAVESSKAWDMQAAAVRNVESGVKSTSKAANRSLQQLEKQAALLQANTFIGDESILQGVTAQMLTFTNVTESRFDRAQQAIIDVAAKLNGLNVSQENLRSTSLQLGKALNDPVANLGSLGRMGIQFSKSQKSVIKDLVEIGKLSEAQNIILTEIERQYGGTAAALAKTAGGMQLSTKNLTSDMLELVGKGIEPLRIKFLQFLNKVLTKLLPYIKKFTDFIEKNADAIFKTFIDTLTVVWNVIKTGIDVLSFIFKILKPFTPIIISIVSAFAAYKGVLLVVAAAQQIVNAVMRANPINTVALAIGILIGLIILIVQHWEEIVTWFKISWYVFVKTAKSIWDNIIGAIKAAIDWIVKIANVIWNTLVAAFKAAIDWIVKTAVTIWETLVKAFQIAVDWIANVGEKFTFILGPIGFLISALIEVAKQWDNIVEAFKTGDILGGILKIGGALVSGLLAPIQGFLELVSKIPGLGGLAKKGALKIAEIRAGLTGETLTPVSPAERSATIREERTSSGELIIRDETGRAEIKNQKEKQGYKIKLQPSGAF